MIKESRYLIGQDVQAATLNQKLYLGDKLHTNKLRYLILSRDIDDQRILQSGSTRGTTGHTQPNVVVSDAAFLSLLSPCKKI